MTPEAQLKQELEATACELSHAELADDVQRKLLACREEILLELKNLREDLESGFPLNKDGKRDLQGHANYHDKMIRAAEAQERFWTELRLDLAKKGAWSLLTVVVGLLLIGAAAKLGIKVIS